MPWLWIAVLAVALLGIGACIRSRAGRDSLPAVLSNFPIDLASPELQPHGIWADGWVDRETRATLRQPAGNVVLTVKGTVPEVEPGFRSSLRVFLDGKEIGLRDLDPGDFLVQAPVPASSGKRRVELRFGSDQQLPGPDLRRVAARVLVLGFQALDKPSRVGFEIVLPDTGIHLADGWYPLETFSGATFRWAENDVRLCVQGQDQPSRRLSLDVESGPGFDWKPFTLRVLDSNGTEVAAAKVRERQKVVFDVPVRPGLDTEYRLHVEGGGKAAKGDARILNFRVFSISSIRP